MDPKRIANETLTAFQKGSYTSPEGVNIEHGAHEIFDRLDSSSPAAMSTPAFL